MSRYFIWTDQTPLVWGNPQILKFNEQLPFYPHFIRVCFCVEYFCSCPIYDFISEYLSAHTKYCIVKYLCTTYICWKKISQSKWNLSMFPFLWLANWWETKAKAKFIVNYLWKLLKNISLQFSHFLTFWTFSLIHNTVIWESNYLRLVFMTSQFLPYLFLFWQYLFCFILHPIMWFWLPVLYFVLL